METIEKYLEAIEEIRLAWREQRFDHALARTNELLKEYPSNPSLLVMRSNLLELQENVDEESLPFDQVKKDLELAIALDDESPETLIELGHYYFVHEDDAKEARKYFDTAIAICERFLSEAREGQAAVEEQLANDQTST